MMNRIGIGALAVLLAAPFAHAQSAGVSRGSTAQAAAVKGIDWPGVMIFGRFETHRPSDPVFQTVYGNGTAFGGEARLRAARRVYVGVEVGYLKTTGTLTVTREPTTLTIYPITGMVVFYLAPGKIAPYVSGGATAYKYSETNFIGTTNDLGYGWATAGGVTLRLGSRGVLDARLKYSSVDVKPSEETVNLGGLALGVAAGVKF